MNQNKGDKIRSIIDELPLSGIELLLHLSENHKALSLGIGEPNFDTSKHIIKAAVRALEHGHTHYSPDRGLMELREAIADKTKRDNNFEPDPVGEVIVTAGTSPALFGAIQTIIDPGDEVIIPTPSYFAYDSIVRIFDGRPVHVPTVEESGFVPTPDDIMQALSSKTKLLVICSPNNPTGGVWEKQDLQAAIDLAEDHDFLILSDELYEKIVYDGVKNFSPASLDNAFERTITLNGLSKSHAMTGFRIGWIIAPPDIATSFCKIHQYSTICAPVISQEAAIAALNGPQDAVREMVAEYDRRKKLMIDRINTDIPMMQVESPKGSFFMFVNVKELIENKVEDMKISLRTEGKELIESLPQYLFSSKDLDQSGSLVTMLYLATFAKVLTASGSFFGPDGEGYLRLSFAQTYELIEEALLQLSETLNKFD